VNLPGSVTASRVLGSRAGQYGFWVLVLLSVVALATVLARTAVRDWPMALALVPVLPLAYFALTRPAFVVYAIAFTSPLTSGMARGAIAPFFRANELLLIAYLGVALVTFLARKRVFKFTWLDGLLLTFLAFRCLLPTVVSLIRGEPFHANSFKVFFGPVQYYLVYRMVLECVSEERQVRRAIFLMLSSSGIVAFVGVLQAIQIPGINEILHTYYPSKYDMPSFLGSQRVTSLFQGDWNGCGLYLAMNVILGLGVIHLYRPKWQKVFLFSVVFLDLVVVILTGSFTATLCLILGTVLVFTFNKSSRVMLRPLLYVLPLAVALLAGVFWPMISHRLGLQFRDTTSLIPHTWQVRVNLWTEILWAYVERDWLWGIGTYQANWSTEENYYFYVILKAGIFGLVSYVLLLAVMLGRLRMDFKHDGTWRGALAVIIGIQILQILIANMSGMYFELSGVAEIPWFMVGFLVGAGGWGRRGPPRTG
jgi:hypothetical protein